MANTNLLEMFALEVAGHALLTAEQERQVCARIQEGVQAQSEIDRGNPSRSLKKLVRDGIAARNELVLSNQRLVLHRAQSFRGSRVDLVDLVQEGNLGLIRAAEKFDSRKGFKFSTYAIWWISVYMSRCSAEKGSAVRIPLSIYANIDKVARARERLEAQRSQCVTPAEIAAESGLTIAQVEQALTLVRVVPLETSLSDGAKSLDERVPDSSAGDPAELAAVSDSNERLHGLVRRLSPLQQQIVALRFGLDGSGTEMSRRAVGQIVEMSPYVVGKLEREALESLAEEVGEQ